MNDVERLVAIDAIRQLKARYFRGVDQNEGDLVRTLLAPDCMLDYRGCCTDPITGRDFIPAMNVVLRGRKAWVADGMAKLGIVSVHQAHTFEIEFETETSAYGIWSMTDRLHFPPGHDFAVMTGYGHYHDTYEQIEGVWMLKTTRISRLRVEAS